MSLENKTSQAGRTRPSRRGITSSGCVFPQINPGEPEGLWHFWPVIKSQVVALNYFGLCRNQVLYTRAKSMGIKEALNYRGTTIATLIGENWNLDRIDINAYASDLDQMGFDFGTTVDSYVYPDDPLAAQWDRVQWMLDKANQLAKKNHSFKLIGVVQGWGAQQIRFGITQLAQLGINRMVLTSADTAQRKQFGGILDFLKFGEKINAWRWLMGINSLSLVRRFRAEAMSGYAWLYMAAKGYVYGYQGWVKASGPGFCRHDLCRKLANSGLSMPELRARHNVLALTKFDADLGEETELE